MIAPVLRTLVSCSFTKAGISQPLRVLHHSYYSSHCMQSAECRVIVWSCEHLTQEVITQDKPHDEIISGEEITAFPLFNLKHRLQGR